MGNVRWTKEEKDWITNKVVKKGVHPIDFVEELNKAFKKTPFRSISSLRHKLTDMGVEFQNLVPHFEIEKKIPVKEQVAADVAKKRMAEKVKEVSAKYIILAKEKSIGDRCVQVLKDEVPKLPEPKLVWKSKETKVSHETAVLLLSDFHIGEIVSKKETFGFGEYNFDVFTHRLKFLAESIRNITMRKLRGYKINKLCLLMLGDMVSGMIHEELTDNAEDIIFQVLNGAYVTAQFVSEMSTLFEYIEIDGVVGNHGRLYKKVRYKKRHTNWDYVFYQFLSLFLSSHKRVKCNFPKSFFEVKKIYNWNFLLLHGDGIRGWMGIPWYGIQKAMWKIGDLLQSQSKTVLHYKVLGHFHHTGELDRTPGEILLNGSLIGGGEYSLGALFEFDRPTQLFFGVHKEIGVTWRYPLRADFKGVDEVIPYAYNTNLDAGKYMQEFLKKTRDE